MSETDSLTKSEENNEKQEMSDNSTDILRFLADSAGYEDYTYEDIIGSWNNKAREIGDYINNLGIFTTCNRCIESTADAIINTSVQLERALEQKLMNDNNDIVEIADNLKKTSDQEKMRNTTVKVKLSLDKLAICVMIKQKGENKYVSVPYEKINNPVYIQNIFDLWFDQNLKAAPFLFKELSKYYAESRRNHSPNWFEAHTEWIKFTYIDGSMKPCGYKRYKNMDEDVSESYDN